MCKIKNKEEKKLGKRERKNKSLSVLVKGCRIKRSGNNTCARPVNLPNFRDW